MPYLLNLVYLSLLVACSPWLLYKALRTGKYREGWGAKFLGRVPKRTDGGCCVWFHAVSVGEVNVLAPLLTRLEAEHPDWTCVISVTTKTGFELAMKKYSPRTVFYCPLDFSWAVRRAVRRMRPALLVLCELELWPNFVRAARDSGASVAVINGRLSEKSARGYARIRPLVRRLLHRIDLIAVQNSEYADRFRQLGADEDSLVTTGSIKFDGAETDRGNEQTMNLATLWNVRPDHAIFLAGSTQAPEESLALETFRRLADLFPQLRLIITPRHPERFGEVAEMLSRSGLPWQRRSELRDATETNGRILLVDAVGELGAWWGLSQIGYVGGSMGQRGGQNMIEPAAFGVAVSFGPNTSNFRDVVGLMLQHDAAVVVKDQEDLVAFVRRCLENRDFAAGMGDRAKRLVRDQQGAADRTCQRIEGLLAQRTQNSPHTSRDR